MENTMFDLVKICHHKQFLCIYDDVDDIIESALEFKLLSINSQRLDKKEQKVKNVVEQPAECRNHAEKSLQNFRVIHKNDVLPPSDDNDDDYNLLLEEVDLFLSDDSIPPSIENVANDPEGDVRFLEELLIDDSILSHESFDSSFEDSP
nr:hypothetical protein [Tanacetum cinerariifolium]